LQTLTFVALVCGNQATMYAVRARKRIWSSPIPAAGSSYRPSPICDRLGPGRMRLAYGAIAVLVLGSVLAGAIAFAFVLDLVKLSVFNRLKII
jgi:H+-transporting ATPase